MNERAMASDSLIALTSYLDALPEPRILLDGQYRILAANAAYRREFGLTGPVAGRRCFEVSHHFTRPCDEMGESCPLRASHRSGGPQRVLHVHHTPRGEEHVDVELTPLRGATGEIEYYVELISPVRDASARPESQMMVGRSRAFNQMLSLIGRVAPSDAAVLLLGESGTGKEMVARAVHEASARAAGPFVAIDCSGLTESLFESELFGYEKGAFTGAARRKPGLVEIAAGGTLFLDEVGDIPLALQVKLLRLLETGTYRRVGGLEPLRADFRFVGATHRDLVRMVAEETFRKDLYYRISTFPIRLPPLRERLEDLPLLAEALLKRVSPAREMQLHPDALGCLVGYDFPGNIRELRNVLERACLLADGSLILPEHLPGICAERAPAELSPMGGVVPLAQMEDGYLRWASRQPDITRKELAARLGLSERTLFRKMARLRNEE
ncbi:MAG: sigma-54-dependent Fis family transcriptional regulator [Betaproteobacteria bacterium]|nr:sigma-54-dependent Fis family transcriptional regulator [Betaproteobacteria bacterium]